MQASDCIDTESLLAQMAKDKKRIAVLEAKVREWEAWFDALVRFDGDEAPKLLEE